MYKPNQRRVRIEAMTVAGWVDGTLHVALKTTLLAAVNRDCHFLPLTEVNQGTPASHEDFLALRREAIHLLVPQPDGSDPHAGGLTGQLDAARVKCLLPQATVEGTTPMLGGQRVSDYLETSPGFIALADCELVPAEGERRVRVPCILVNTAHVLGVTEVKTSRTRETEPIGAELVGTLLVGAD
jgi:hypothetical protein